MRTNNLGMWTTLNMLFKSRTTNLGIKTINYKYKLR